MMSITSENGKYREDRPIWGSVDEIFSSSCRWSESPPEGTASSDKAKK